MPAFGWKRSGASVAFLNSAARSIISPLVIEQARRIIQRPEIQVAESPAARIDTLYRLLFARPAGDRERQIGLAFVSDGPRAAEESLGNWQRYAQLLLLSNEFTFVD